jgi:ABC-type sugar transport system ATPase subunit
MVRSPKVLLMDEPLSNLDARLRTTIRAEIKRIHRETGVTIVYVTHDQAEALSLGERVAVLERGALRQVGTPDEVYGKPANVFVAGFLGSPPMNLLSGRVEDGEIIAGAVRLPAPRTAGSRPEVIAGFRPEAAKPARTGDGFDAVLEVAESVGHERIWHLRADSERIAVRPPGDLAADEGERLRVDVPREAVVLFDPSTGDRL